MAQGGPAPGEVSVYVPCYNATRWIDEVLPALFAQTLPPAEVIVVDDGSRDETAARAERLGARVIRHGANRGLAAARNTAVRSVTTSWIASVDADVVASPDWLATLARGAVAGGFAGACGQLEETRLSRLADRWRDTHLRQWWGESRIEDPPFLFGNNTLFSRAALEQAGLYDERCRTNGEDHDISSKLKQAGLRLLYDPSARCRHLREDTVRSICRTVWRYNNHRPVPPTFHRTRRARRRGRRIVGAFLREDLRQRRWRLAALDVVMNFEWMAHEWGRFLRGRG